MSSKTPKFSCHYYEKLFQSQKTLFNHKCTFCISCKKIFSSYQRLLSHNCFKIIQCKCKLSFSNHLHLNEHEKNCISFTCINRKEESVNDDRIQS